MSSTRCSGEVLGRAETYLFTVALIQQFKFKAVAGIRPSLGYIPGINMHPKHFSAVIEVRE